MARALDVFGEGAVATLFGRKELMPAPTAALFNAATGQIIEWDDWVLISHVGACVVPTAFAAGEMVGGLFYFNYPGASGLTSGAVFGRLAGKHAARAARSLVTQPATAFS